MTGIPDSRSGCLVAWGCALARMWAALGSRENTACRCRTMSSAATTAEYDRLRGRASRAAR
jgi:hypothetical protein